MWFVRSLSDALKFRPWLRFWSLVCISSGCGRFVAMWGLWLFVWWFFGFPVAVDRRQLFRLAWRRISSAMGFYFALWVLLRLWSFFRSVGLWMLCSFWQRFRFWAWLWCRLLGMVCPLFFRLPFGILCGFFCFHGSIIPGAGRRSRLPFSASGLICLYNLPAFV